MFTRLESELIHENEKLKQKVVDLQEEINYLKKANKRVRRKNKKYKKFINLIKDKLELKAIENEVYFVKNYYFLTNDKCCQELTYSEYELMKDVFEKIKPYWKK